MEETEYKDNERVYYRTTAKLKLPHKEPEEVLCFVTEGHVAIEAEVPIKVPLFEFLRYYHITMTNVLV